MRSRIKSTYREFPLEYWMLVLANFIDSIGGTMIWPFFALYVTQKFGVGMTEVGLLIAIFSVSGFIGSMLGGALADKFGRLSHRILSSLSRHKRKARPTRYGTRERFCCLNQPYPGI